MLPHDHPDFFDPDDDDEAWFAERERRRRRRAFIAAVVVAAMLLVYALSNLVSIITRGDAEPVTPTTIVEVAPHGPDASSDTNA